LRTFVEVSAREAEAEEAATRLKELLRDAIPNTNPDWGVNRLRKELSNRGFVLVGRARSGNGIILRNTVTEDLVRIMERPTSLYRTESPQKRLNRFYCPSSQPSPL
jgi:predicted transcriptional regulator